MPSAGEVGAGDDRAATGRPACTSAQHRAARPTSRPIVWRTSDGTRSALSCTRPPVRRDRKPSTTGSTVGAYRRNSARSGERRDRGAHYIDDAGHAAIMPPFPHGSRCRGENGAMEPAQKSKAIVPTRAALFSVGAVLIIAACVLGAWIFVRGVRAVRHRHVVEHAARRVDLALHAGPLAGDELPGRRVVRHPRRAARRSGRAHPRQAPVVGGLLPDGRGRVRRRRCRC